MTHPAPRWSTAIRSSLALLAALLCSAVPALAKRAPDPVDGPRLISLPQSTEDALQSTQLESSSRLQYGASGVLRRYWLGQSSASKSGRPMSSSQAPRDVALAFMNARARALGLDALRIQRDLVLDSEKQSPSGTHLRYQQAVNGVPVWRSEIVLKVTSDGEVSSMQNNLKPVSTLDTRPTLDADKAIAAALQAVGPVGRAIGDFKAELYVLPLSGGPRLAYVVSLPLETPSGDWRAYVDAKTGAILGLEDAMVYATGTGRVFDPDPVTKMADSTFLDLADADNAVPFPASYDTRTLQDITFSAGVYSLSGPFAKLIDNEAPTVVPVTATDADSFQFQRSPSGFEDVMCYYHLDFCQRYIQSLGFLSVNNRVQECDSHGLSGADNSHYVPSTKRVAFGEGGIDDGEDTDIVWHEYGHSIQDNIVPGWGGGQEGAMGEGFGDYWAVSYSRSVYPAFQINHVFNWDGNGETWNGRLAIDTGLHYPEDANGEVHDSGTLWCSALTDCWNQVGRAVMDRLVLDHTFALGTTASMADAAAQILQSDFDLYGGTHVAALVNRFGFWGMVNPADYVPTITHTPLGDTENTTGPYPVIATITSVTPLDTSSLMVFWGIGALTDSLPMTTTGNPNEYSASIPGPLSNVDVRYYIRARDNNGGTSTHPLGAPGSYHQFHVGADVIPPVLSHTPISNTPVLQWPRTVSATITDNQGVNPASVLVSWTLNGTPKTSFALTRVGSTNVYNGPFPSLQSDVVAGDSVKYHIDAADIAAVPNTVRGPASGEYGFQIITALGVVLVLDDDEVAKQSEPKPAPVDAKDAAASAGTAATPGDALESANDIAAILNSLGYVASVEPAATSNPATWTTYSFIVSSSGLNEAPVANATYRTAIENYVAGGGKLLIEGGEVAYDVISTPGYPTFRTNVLHATAWAADNAGSLHLLAAQAGHPIATLPNVLPATLPITYTAYGSEDSYSAVAPAYIVYGTTTQTANGGILVYDNTPATQSAQIVLLGFNFKQLGTLTERTQLLQNVAAYLVAPEAAPTSSVAGNVTVAHTADNSGVSVTLQPGGSQSTGTPGTWSFTGLYSGSYTLSFSKAGYRTEIRSVALGVNEALAGVHVILFPQPAESVCVAPALSIPDNNPTGVSSNVTVTNTWAVQGVSVDLNLTHTYIGDLIIELRHGAKNVRLKNRTGGSADNIVGNWPATFTVDGPGALSDFNGDPANGTWTLFVSDNAGIDVGTVNSWCLKVMGPADTSYTTGVGAHAPVGVAMLMPAAPNPARSSGSLLRFSLPTAQKASLGIYDVTGRLVRSLLDGPTPAGERDVRWDGRDSRGRLLPAGVYMVHLRAGTFEQMQRVVFLP